MKYVIIDQIRGGDCFIDEFESKEEALKELERHWDHLTDHDKKLRSDFYLLESLNPDPEKEGHLDGNIIKRCL